MIDIKLYPNAFKLDITGHAEHGEKGEDIVCAAVSTLFYTLAEALYEYRHMMKEDIIFSDEDGNGHIECKPKSEFEANVSLIYWTIMTGFDLVARNYEKNVKFEVVVG